MLKKNLHLYTFFRVEGIKQEFWSQDHFDNKLFLVCT